jgi:hypothetical protein
MGFEIPLGPLLKSLCGLSHLQMNICREKTIEILKVFLEGF